MEVEYGGHLNGNNLGAETVLFLANKKFVMTNFLFVMTSIF